VLPTGPLFANNGDIVVPLLVAGRDRLASRLHCRRGTEVGGARPHPDRLVAAAGYLHLLSPPSRLRPARVRALSDHLVETLKPSCTLAHEQFLAM
jgi:hypothetical protein